MAEIFSFGISNLYITKTKPEFQPQLLLLKDLFRHFNKTPLSQTNAVHLRLCPADTSGFLKNSFKLFSTPLCQVYQNGCFRICIYSREHKVLIRQHHGQIKISVQAPSDELTDEILYLLFLSFSGELLDRQGWHRIHSAGTVENAKASVYPRASLYGKSNYTLNYLESRTGAVLGDENVLTDGRQVAAFATAIHLKGDRQEKTSSPFYFARRQKKLWGERYLFLIPAERVSPPTGDFSLYFKNILQMFLFSLQFPLGLGVVQMREFMIRPDNFYHLIFIFLRRLKTLVYFLPRMKLGDFKSDL